MDYYICDCQRLHVSLHSPLSPTLVLFSDHHCWVVPAISLLLFSTPHPLSELSTSLSLDATCPRECSEFFFLLSQNWHSQHPHTFLTQENPLFMIRSLSICVPDLFSPFILSPGLSPSPLPISLWPRNMFKSFPSDKTMWTKQILSLHSSFCLSSHGFSFLSLPDGNTAAFFTRGRFSTSLAFHCYNSVPLGILLWILASILSHFWDDRPCRWTFCYCVDHLGSTAWKKEKLAWVRNFSPIGTMDKSS